jgi:hypothetical protein
VDKNNVKLNLCGIGLPPAGEGLCDGIPLRVYCAREDQEHISAVWTLNNHLALPVRSCSKPWVLRGIRRSCEVQATKAIVLLTQHFTEDLLTSSKSQPLPVGFRWNTAVASKRETAINDVSNREVGCEQGWNIAVHAQLSANEHAQVSTRLSVVKRLIMIDR